MTFFYLWQTNKLIHFCLWDIQMLVKYNSATYLVGLAVLQVISMANQTKVSRHRSTEHPIIHFVMRLYV